MATYPITYFNAVDSGTTFTAATAAVFSVAAGTLCTITLQLSGGFGTPDPAATGFQPLQFDGGTGGTSVVDVSLLQTSYSVAQVQAGLSITAPALATVTNSHDVLVLGNLSGYLQDGNGNPALVGTLTIATARLLTKAGSRRGHFT